MSSIMIAPTGVQDALRLKGWYEHEGGSAMNFETYKGELMGGGEGGSGPSSRDWNLISDLRAPGVGTNPKPDYFTCKVSVLVVALPLIHLSASTLNLTKHFRPPSHS